MGNLVGPALFIALVDHLWQSVFLCYFLVGVLVNFVLANFLFVGSFNWIFLGKG